MRAGRVALGVLALILVIMLAGPFLIPVPLLEGTVPPEQLADPDSLFVRSIQSRGADLIALAWHDPAKIMPETLEGYKKPLRAENWDTALWNFTSANHAANLTGRLGELTTPVLVITGDDDRIIPTKQSIRLAGELSNATLAVISNAGHVPHEETPAAFMQAVEGFLTSCILKNLVNFHV